MKNPFIFGRAVMGKYFVDREEDINVLRSAMLSGQHVVLFSPRKMGKTSLIKETFRRTEEAICIYLDLWQVTSTYSLGKEIINSVVNETYGSIEKLGRDLKDLFKALRPKISIDMEGHIGVELEKGEEEEVLILKEALNFPEKVARKKGVKLIIAFDEFQEIEHLDGLELEKLFRSILQHHENVSYIFAGSERSLINIIFGAKERPFYRFAKHIVLEPIDREVLVRFVVNKFAASGKRIYRDAARWTVEFSEGIPYYVQHICHEVWYMAEKEVKRELVEKAIEERILPGLSSGFEVIWKGIKSEGQRKLLIGIANENQPQIYSQRFIEKYRLKSPGHVRKAIKSLEGIGLIEEGRIWDIFFREWVKQNFYSRI